MFSQFKYWICSHLFNSIYRYNILNFVFIKFFINYRNIVDPSEKTSVLSTINGVMPLGNFAGVFIGFLMGKKFTNK